MSAFLVHCVDVCKRIVGSVFFQRFIVAVIVCAAVVVGIETYPALVASLQPLLEYINGIILAIFVIEVLVRIVAQGRKPWKFFRDGWNVLDFVIVAVGCLPLDLDFIYVLRLIRILRVVRLITTLPRLQVIVGALLRSLPSVGYVSILLFILLYIYAVIGVHFFGANDPLRFADLPTALLTMFTAVTMEDWIKLMYTAMHGCDQYGYRDAQHLCTAPQAQPLLAPLFFLSFVLIGTMIVLNLFIGVIINTMIDQQQRADLRVKLRRQQDVSIRQEFQRLNI